MRTALKKLDQVRKRFRGVFQREGKKTNWHGYADETILLRSITDEAGKVVADHLWFTRTKSFDALGILEQGDVVEFEARITSYRKGYVNRRINIDQSSTDYKLTRPTKLRIVRN